MHTNEVTIERITLLSGSLQPRSTCPAVRNGEEEYYPNATELLQNNPAASRGAPKAESADRALQHGIQLERT
jgi:hypothetical protein